MLYKSTRGNSPEVPFSQVLLGGLAPDGGLYMPERFPQFTKEEINSWSDLEFHQLASNILFPFVDGEIDKVIFSKLVKEAYETFDTDNVVELKEISANRWVLELFHGPTLAFKDVAMQLLGSLLNHFAQERGEKIVVLGATSGDTGAAAISACSRHENVEVYILYPQGKVTDFQRKQMTTTQSENVFPMAIETDFDGCQDIVKQMFMDDDLKNKKVRFIAANSINWARCMTQSVYFFWTYLRLSQLQDELTFSIPSGNFGHAYAGWTAKEMGLPIKRLLIATNTNDVLHKAFSLNNYEKSDVIQTLAPSMDISVASNFERLLYNLYDNNSSMLAAAMSVFPEQSISIPKDKQDLVSNFFKSHKSDDEEILEQIGRTYDAIGYMLDPHTATGVKAGDYLTPDEEPVVVMGTAHPAKFSEAIEKAVVGYNSEIPIKLQEAFKQEEIFNLLPKDYSKIKDFILKNAL
ncbi:MAG: threonine synthase [Gammaproteobacteria bacterium]|nr:MAG: threonine synthase [Gammaproteobacteria bacterium]